MGRCTCYVVAKKDDYVKLAEKRGAGWEGLCSEPSADELYECLNIGVNGGIEFVDEDGFCELRDDDECEWFTCDDGLLVADVDGDDRVWTLGWRDAGAKLEWFRPYYEKFREDVDHYVNHNFGLEDFAKWESLNPPWRLEKSYERQYDGCVAILDDSGHIVGTAYPMEFLRLVKPGDEWVLAKAGWLYKP